MANLDLVADLLKALSDEGNLDHFDAYGFGALYALDLQEAFEELQKMGWQFNKNVQGYKIGDNIYSPDDVTLIVPDTP